MNFLKNTELNKRLEIQFNGFLKTKNLSFLKDLIPIQTFDFDFNSIVFSKDLNVSLKTNLRLGNRLEYFFAFCLSQSLDYEILAKNIQIIQDKITIGELDFIVLDKIKNSIFHIEIANKFYLFDSNIKGKYKQWIGPNRKDSLLQKMNKLEAKQFPLLFHEKTQELLSSLEIDINNIQQQLLFKTLLFVPLCSYNERRDEPNIEGFYITDKEFHNKEYSGYVYFIPEKQDWQVNPSFCENWFTFQEVESNIKMYLKENKSPLVWVKKPNETFEKFFITWW